jgi:serine/threonine-protein kinase
MGQVYRAFDPRLERTVALKVIVVSPDIARTKGPLKKESDRGGGTGSDTDEKTQLSARWLREARAVASLSHPNVVAIYDVGETEGRLWLAMEYVVGSALRSLVGQGELPLARRIRFLVEVARALEAAHKSGIIHRDIKPENVMIREDGAVKVLDFGIARRTVSKSNDDQQKIDTITGGGAISGTPVYMAPEAIKGGDVDARCDQFAWGVMAYELITGGRPWVENGDVLAVVANILTEIPPPIKTKVSDIPALVDDTIMRALAKDPKQRFTAMADVADALEPFAATNTSGERVRVTPSNPHHDDAAFAATTKVPTTVTVPPAADAPTNTVPSAKPKRGWQLALPLFLIGALAASVYYVTRPKDPGPRIHAIPTVTPRPLSDNPKAEEQFKSAMHAWHDGASAQARSGLTEALKLEPDFAAAHLELALLQAAFNDRPAAQAEFTLAFQHRAFLLPRDEMLLEASVPFIRPTGAQPDLEEWETRMTSVVFQHPRDPELQYWLGRARQAQGDHRGAKTAFEAALHLDDAYAPALAALARTERALGDTGAALTTTEKCIKRSPIASLCVETRFDLMYSAGECQRAKEEAARWELLEPTSPKPFAAMARALHPLGVPRPSIEEVLSHRWSNAPAADQKRMELWDRAFLAVLDGDFTKADDLAKDYDAALPLDADSSDHAAPARLRVNVLRETDRPKDAAKVARTFLDRMAAWPAFPFLPDPSIDFYEPLYRAGEMSKKDLDAKRTEWLESEQRRTAEGHAARSPWVDWFSVYAGFAETREEALEALAKAPKMEPKGAGLGVDFALGKAYALTGRWDDAIPPLKRVDATCNTFESLLVVMRARLFLAQAEEAKGDIASARAHYQQIVDKWNPKTTGSRTAKKAAERLAALPKE